MKTLKLKIKPKSSFASKIQSDTLFGHLSWVYLEKFGEKKLREFLLTKNNIPAVVFSDAFPADFLPKPILNYSDAGFKNKNDKFENKKSYVDFKKVKKTRYIKKEIINRNRENLTSENILIKSDLDKKNIEEIITKTQINRITGNVEEGNLFQITENFYDENFFFDIYIKYDEEKIWKELLIELIEIIGKIGYGRDASTGKGKFIIDKISQKPEELESIDNPTHYINLSSGITCSNSTLLYGKAITKFGKHGNYLANSDNPFKNPVRLYISGSVFKIKELKEVYGKYLDNVSKFSGHVNNAFMLPYFCNLKEV